ncbi:MAG: crosslink repair DNA glycosylase YcaQ family protein [Anaerolineaceae bacterium]
MERQPAGSKTDLLFAHAAQEEHAGFAVNRALLLRPDAKLRLAGGGLFDTVRDGADHHGDPPGVRGAVKEGPLDTIALRKKTRLTGPGSDSRFNRALESLQVDMRILPVGVARVGAWHYAFVYDCVHHHIPEVIEASARISEKEARLYLLELYFKSMGAAPFAEVMKIFGWPARVMEQSMDGLAGRGEIVRGLEMEGSQEEWLGLNEIYSLNT